MLNYITNNVKKNTSAITETSTFNIKKLTGLSNYIYSFKSHRLRFRLYIWNVHRKWINILWEEYSLIYKHKNIQTNHLSLKMTSLMQPAKATLEATISSTSRLGGTPPKYRPPLSGPSTTLKKVTKTVKIAKMVFILIYKYCDISTWWVNKNYILWYRGEKGYNRGGIPSEVQAPSLWAQHLLI